MATTPRGDDSELRRSVIGDLARAVARQQLAGSVATTPPGRSRKLRATYLRAAPASMVRALPKTVSS